MTFSLPEPKPYPGYEIERFESEGGSCGRSGANNDRVHEDKGTDREKSSAISRESEETCELRGVVPNLVLGYW